MEHPKAEMLGLRSLTAGGGNVVLAVGHVLDDGGELAVGIGADEVGGELGAVARGDQDVALDADLVLCRDDRRSVRRPRSP